MSFVPNYLSQRDPRWKDEKLGFDNSITLGSDGCALTCLAMFVNGYGFNETPSSMNQKLKAMGSGAGFLGGLIVWSGLTRAFPKIVYREITICRDQPAPLDAINASLDSGQPVIVEVDRSPSPGLQNHWVVLYQRQGSDYLMLDPWPQPPDNKETHMVGRFGEGREAARVITAVVWYQATGTQPPPPPPPEGLTVRVAAAATTGLRLRSTPSTSGLILATEPPGTLLKCFEPDAVVLSKLGVSGQWLQVSDSDYEVGYVAAWYVERPGTPPPPPPPSGLKVYVMQNVGSTGLRLRAAPNTTAGVLATLPAGTELTVLEDKTQAQAKIGQMNQWLNVRDPGERNGYVAAWYVELTSSPPPPPGGLTVKVSGQATAGLNLREAPSPAAKARKVLPAGTVLQVLEAQEAASAKIGVVNQWLNVKDPVGETGYVAAWYVEK
jgi:hypothetical protein